MEFASKHVYLGAEEENELDDDVLESVEQAGGLMNAVNMAQQQQQQQQQAPQQLDPRGRSVNEAGLVDYGDEAPEQAEMQLEQAQQPKKSFFSRLFGGASSSGSGSSASGSSSGSNKKKEKESNRRSSVERAAPMKPQQQQPQQQQQQQQQQSASFLNFLNRSSAPAPSRVSFDESYGGRMPLRRYHPDLQPAAAQPQPAHMGPPPPPVGGFGMPPPPPPPPAPFGAPPPPAAASSKSAKPRRVYKRAVDTNLLAIKFATLANNSDDLFAGDAILCKECGAALNHLSVLKDCEGKIVQRVPQQQSVAASSSSSAASSAPAAAAGIFGSQVAPGGLAIVPEVVPASQEPAASAAAAAPGPLPVVVEAGQQLWECDFCSHPNVLDELSPAEIPSNPSRDYVLEPAPVVEGAAGAKKDKDEMDQTYVVFVLDISGSMCVSAPVAGKIKLKGAKALDPSLLAYADVDMNGVNNGNVTYISRLQSVQASIDAQLTTLAKTHPNQRVLLITFNGEVTIVGDGSAGTSVVIAGDKLNQEGELQRIGRDYGVGKPISQSAAQLSQALFNLEETGPTALGPALVTAISIASRQRGSRVIVCTDGLANVGLGSMTSKDLSPADIESWYQGQGVRARDAGVSVNVLSIKGDECRLEALGLVAAETLGAVQRVDPASIVDQFAEMLANPLIATNVSVTFFLHKGMQFRNEDQQLQQQQQQQEEEEIKRKKAAAAAAAPVAAEGTMADVDAAGASSPPIAPPLWSLSKLTRVVGNVTKDSETALEYGLRDRAVLASYAHLATLPFQAQITFTTLQGMKAMRVLTQAQPITADRAVAEAGVKLELISAQVASKSAALARDGHYKAARLNWIAASPMLARAAQTPQQQQTFSNYAQEIDVFDRTIAQQQRMEEAAGGGSDNEEEEERERKPAAGAAGAGAASSSSSNVAKKPGFFMKKSKKAQLSDESYRVIHKTHQLNSAGLM